MICLRSPNQTTAELGYTGQVSEASFLSSCWVCASVPTDNCAYDQQPMVWLMDGGPWAEKGKPMG